MSELECPEGLIYVSPDNEGFTRQRRGKGFGYHTVEGKKVDDPAILERISSLGIPPVWKKVWICKDARGHLQATGYDPKQRKQYLYHPEWVTYRNLAKFSRMGKFGYILPHIRQHTFRLLQQSNWTKEKVLALVIQMLDEHHIRIGNEYYKEHNETFGLTTLRRKHLDFEEGVGRLEYKAKSGKYRKVNLVNNQLVKLVKECAELPGYEIFTYKDQNRKYQSINSQEVNEFLHQVAGDQFSSKDFRTWGGTTLVVEKEEEARQLADTSPNRKLTPSLVKLVAAELGNTQRICKEYYIHPEVLTKVVRGEADKYKKMPIPRMQAKEKRLLRDSEKTVINMISS